MTGQPKFLSKTLLAKLAEREERAIFIDIFNLLKQGASCAYIIRFIVKKHGLSFKDDTCAYWFIRDRVNRYLPNCILCGHSRYNDNLFTLYCKFHYDEWVRKNKLAQHSWEIDLLEKMEEDPQYWNGSMGFHGDLTDKVIGFHNKLGTSTLGSHRNIDSKKSEAAIIKNELKKLGLRKNAKESKRKKENDAYEYSF